MSHFNWNDDNTTEIINFKQGISNEFYRISNDRNIFLLI